MGPKDLERQWLDRQIKAHKQFLSGWTNGFVNSRYYRHRWGGGE